MQFDAEALELFRRRWVVNGDLEGLEVLDDLLQLHVDARGEDHLLNNHFFPVRLEDLGAAHLGGLSHQDHLSVSLALALFNDHLTLGNQLHIDGSGFLILFVLPFLFDENFEAEINSESEVAIPVHLETRHLGLGQLG